jgi:hypothetical protein
MGFFRRREPLHEQLAREGGLVVADPRPAWQETGIHGLHRPSEWDTTVTAAVPGIEGNAARWVALPDGTLLVEDGPDGTLDPLAAVVEERIQPPYRARAARQTGDIWAVQAARIEVLALPDAPEGDTLDLARSDGAAALSVDGAQVFGSLPALEERGEREGSEFAVHAERLDGDLWEVRAAAL